MKEIINDIIRRRSLIQQLVIKDLRVRYRRPLMGFLWAFFLPLSTVGVFYIAFYLILKVKIEETPFILYLMSAVFPWSFFQGSLVGSVTSLVDNKNLIRESNFPQYLIPLSIVLANGVNFIPALVVLIITSLCLLRGLPGYILLLPIVLAAHLFTALGLAIIFSILYLRWRDTKYIAEVVLSLLFYLTPGFYSLVLVKNAFVPAVFTAYMCNPLVGILNLYRLTILKGFSIHIQKYAGFTCLYFIPIVFSIVILLLGVYFFKKNRHIINDYISY